VGFSGVSIEPSAISGQPIEWPMFDVGCSMLEEGHVFFSNTDHRASSIDPGKLKADG
jgi:hypothetical protein